MYAAAGSSAPTTPVTPATPATPKAYGSTPDSLTTPPSSIRQYSSALQMIMKQGMSAAMADMKDGTRAAERDFDREFGYGDEDPIERHVKLYLTPRKGVDRLSALPSHPLLHVEELVTRGNSTEADQPLKPFRPGLIHFTRSNSAQHSRATPSLASFGRTDSTTSSTFGEDVATPSSDWSEASFEAVKYEDVLSMYGPSHPSIYATDTSSAASAGLAHDRLSVASDMTVMSTSSTATDTTLRAKSARPSLARPRPRTRVSPYPSPLISPAALPEENEEEDWLNGRTVSEQMIVQAGLRCQRGRAAR